MLINRNNMWHADIHKFQTAMEMARTSAVSSVQRETVEEVKRQWIESRKLPIEATFEQIHFEETSPFCSLFEWRNFSEGPNVSAGQRNTIQFVPITLPNHRLTTNALQLSGGTDWSSFQGIHSSFEKFYPRFLEFTVSVADPQVNGGTVALATSVRTWGLFGICFHFRAESGCWKVQKSKTQWENICKAEANKSVDVRVEFDWDRCEMTVSVDGTSKTLKILSEGGEGIDGRGFKKPVGAIAFYNWRKASVSRFSNVVLSPDMPPPLVSKSKRSASDRFSAIITSKFRSAVLENKFAASIWTRWSTHVTLRRIFELCLIILAAFCFSISSSSG